MLRKLFALVLISLTVGASTAVAQKQSTAIDRVEVVVNDDVITHQELQDRTANVIKMLQRQKTMLPERNVLERQVLERMIMEMLQAQFARETGLRIDDAMLDKTI